MEIHTATGTVETTCGHFVKKSGLQSVKATVAGEDALVTGNDILSILLYY